MDRWTWIAKLDAWIPQQMERILGPLLWPEELRRRAEEEASVAAHTAALNDLHRELAEMSEWREIPPSPTYWERRAQWLAKCAEVAQHKATVAQFNLSEVPTETLEWELGRRRKEQRRLENEAYEERRRWAQWEVKCCVVPGCVTNAGAGIDYCEPHSEQAVTKLIKNLQAGLYDRPTQQEL